MVPSWSITNISSMILVAPYSFSKKGNFKKTTGTAFFCCFWLFCPTCFLNGAIEAPGNPGSRMWWSNSHWNFWSGSARAVELSTRIFCNVDVVTSCSTKTRESSEWWKIVPNKHRNDHADLWIIVICRDVFHVTKPCSTTGRNIYIYIYLYIYKSQMYVKFADFQSSLITYLKTCIESTYHWLGFV